MTHKLTRSTIMFFLGMCLLMPKLRLYAETSEISAEADMIIDTTETENQYENIILETEELTTEENSKLTDDVEVSTIETVTVSETEAGTIIATGKSGYANWTLDSEGVLTFFADNLPGPMKDYNYQTTFPDYDDYAELVKKIIIKDDITTIGKMAFNRCENATEIQIGNGVKKIGIYALSGNLKNLYIPASVEDIGLYAFTHVKAEKYIVSEENLNYSTDEYGVLFNKDKTVLLHAPTELEGSYEVPETVTEIENSGFGGFYGCSKLTNLIIGDSVTDIGGCYSDILFGCSSLENLKLGDGITELGENVHLEKLKQISVGKNFALTFQNQFKELIALERIEVSAENGEHISVDGVLYNKDKTKLICCPRGRIGSLEIEAGVTEIRRDALTGSSLSEIILPDSVSGTVILDGSVNLKNVIFSNCVTEISLNECTNLQRMIVPEQVTVVSFENCVSLSEVQLSEQLKTIQSFKNCSSLKKITFPVELKEIAEAAFSGCSHLAEITFQGGYPGTINANSFEGVEAICYYPIQRLTWTKETMLDYGGSLKWVSYNAEEFVEEEKKYLIPDTNITLVYDIDKKNSEITIKNCNSDATGKVEIPEKIGEKKVTAIADLAFYDCVGVADVIIPASVKGIGNEAFKNCTGLVNIQLSEGLTEIGDSAFIDCTSLTSALIPDTVTSIGSAAFQGCKKMTDVKLPDGITTIHENTFLNTGLTSCSIPDTVTTIENCAFKNTKITEITVPKSVSVMGTEIFAKNFQLKKVTLENGIQEIPEKMFDSCYNLVDVVFPNTLKKIKESAFQLCVGLNSVVLPEGLTSIGVSAFCGCGSCDLYSSMDSDNFTSVVLPSTLTEIGRDAFGLCQSLRSITIPKSVTRIEANTFRSCYRLESVILPTTCQYIGDDAFLQCKRLQTVTFQWEAPQITSKAFSSTKATCYYPSNNDAWTTNMLQNYGGTLTWVAQEMSNPGTDGSEVSGQDGKVNVSLDNQTSQSGNGSGSGGGASVTPPENGWKEGSNTFSIECTQPCVALLSTDGGKTYTKLNVVKNAEGVYDCTTDNMTENAILSILLLGDINGDGKVSNSDATAGKAVAMGVNSVDVLKTYAADLNGDGEITNNDITRLKAVILGKSELSW